MAARDHIITHEPGKGQEAFAPHRRDMGAHRAELERRRLDEMDREKREAAASAASAPVATAAPAPSAATALPAALAGLRIAKPLVGGVPGLRVAVPRPRPPVARPTTLIPTNISTSTFEEPAAAPVEVPESQDDEPLAPAPGATSPDLPLLPSHLCSSYFVEPLSWMSPLLDSGVLSGKIVCPGSKCGAKLGSFDWAGQRAFPPLATVER